MMRRLLSSSAHLGSAEVGTGQGNELLLASTQGGATLGQHHVQAHGAALHNRCQVSTAQGGPDLCIAGLTKWGQVGSDCPGEQDRDLQAR